MAWEKSAVRYAKLDIVASSGHNCVIIPIVKQLEKIGYSGGMMAIIKQLGWVDDRSKMRHNILERFQISHVLCCAAVCGAENFLSFRAKKGLG